MPPQFPRESRILRSPNAIVHVDYNPKRLEPLHFPDWTRFVCISDNHARTYPVPAGDVLLHAGDLTRSGQLKEFQITMEWLVRLPHKVKIIIAGNHDFSLHDEWYDVHHARWHQNIGKQSSSEIRDLLKGEEAVAAGIVYLQDEQHNFRVKENGRTWTVYGSPWSPATGRHHWAFQYRESDAPTLVSTFPKTDILLTHTPPLGIFDRTTKGAFVGCGALLDRLLDLRPRIHVMGHIHESHGAHIHAWQCNQAGKFVQPTASDGDTAEDEAEQSLLAFSTEQGESEDMDVDGDDSALPTSESTVFVNAANAPRANRRDGTRVRQETVFGGPGYQPVVVDLKDYPNERDL